MGISNSLGSNTFDILLCLGLPWFIKATFLPSGENKNYVNINSRGLEYNAISLLSTLLLFYVVFALNKFKLDKKVSTEKIQILMIQSKIMKGPLDTFLRNAKNKRNFFCSPTKLSNVSSYYLR